MENRWLKLLKSSFNNWMEDKALRLSAALAYYSIFSIAPLLVITIGIAGLVLGEEAVTGQLYGELKSYVGAQSAEAIQSMVESASKPSQGVIATVTGFVMLMLGASGVFGQLKDALNTIWGVKPKTGQGILAMMRGKFLNFGMVLVIGFLLLVSLMLSTAIAGLNHRLESVLPLPAFVWAAIAFVISLGVVTTLFALIFKVLPDAKIRWRQVWFGALITALLFEIGKTGLGWYLGREGAASAYGAAGAVVLLLLWVYYTSCILFFGAEFTQVYAEAGDGVTEPSANAQRVTTGERAQQGLPTTTAPKPSSNAPTAPAMSRPAPAASSHRLFAPILKYLEGRGLLLSIEAREALQHVISLGIWLAVAVVAIFAGWLLLATTLVGVLTHWLGWSWLKATGVAGGIHILIALM
ncbi:MAG: YihY/virulence factor BrkB family protein, partial [Verrucomicrobiota bacterium]